MHPAKSVIAFTTMSGAGYGLLIAAILGELFGFYAPNTLLTIFLHGTAFTLVSIGLLSSTLHLGHPERAWRAMSQWRTSWLSREGVFALGTYGPWALYVYATLMMENVQNILLPVGIITAVMAFCTIYTTSMIYRSLKAIPAWDNQFVSPIYLVFGLASGVTILSTALNVTGQLVADINILALAGLTLAMLLKRIYWRSIDSTPARSTIETATGLGHLGKVKAHDGPHTHDNYLLKEMGFRVAQKHSKKLRNFYQLMWLLAAVSLMAILKIDNSALASILSIVVLMTTVLGVICERWLFFAEAKHVQSLYYGL